MLADIRTMMWKELRETVGHYADDRAALVRAGLVVVVFAVIFSLQAGEAWVSGVSLGLWIVGPFILITRLITDAFAGERERHTLESLLATRLPNLAILLGKLLAPVLLAWGLTQLLMLLALIPVNVVHGGNGLLLYAPGLAAAGVVLSLLVALLAGAAGVLVSLRAATVRQAQQTMSLGLFALFILPTLLLSLLPRLGINLESGAAPQINLLQVGLAAVGALLLIDAALVAVTMLRFRRERLLLD